MSEKRNVKILLGGMAILAIVMFCFTFSVSYARWSGGATSVAASGGVGSWQNKILDFRLDDVNGDENNKGYSQAVVDLLKTGEGVDTSKTHYGGIIEVDVSGDNVHATSWNQNVLTITQKPYGYTITCNLTAGDRFMISVFNRIVDPTNAQRDENTDGHAVIKGDGASKLSYATTGSADDIARVLFTAAETGTYTFQVYEGTNKRNRPSSGYPDNYDVVTVTFAAP